MKQTFMKISRLQRARRYAIRIQSKIDRALESYVRLNYTDWDPEASEAERSKENKKVAPLINAVKAGEHDDEVLQDMIQRTETARSVWDDFRAEREKEMESIARTLPVWDWAKDVAGFGPKGLAIIVAETTSDGAPLSFSSYIKGLDGIYSRLGFASYGNAELDSGLQYAGSTWKRPSWAGRALTSQEWIDHPFSPVRYAEMFTLGDSLLKQQLISPKTCIIRLPDGKEKRHKMEKTLPDGAVIISEAGERRAAGPYGEVYLTRRARTAQIHPEWTDMHAHRDAQRIAFKALISDLYAAWMRLTPSEFAADGAVVATPARATAPPPRSAAPSKKAA